MAWIGLSGGVIAALTILPDKTEQDMDFVRKSATECVPKGVNHVHAKAR